MKTEKTNINLRIDKELLERIKQNAEDINNSTTKEINEMLWLALKPRSEQIKKVLEIRTSTKAQPNNKTKPENKQTAETTSKPKLKITREEYVKNCWVLDNPFKATKEDYEKACDMINSDYEIIEDEEWEKAEKETIDACNQICEDNL